MSGKTDEDGREHAAAITGAGAEHLAAQLLERGHPDGLAVRFRFADIDIRATCECGWTAVGDSASDAFSAWWKHRRDKHPDAA